MADLQPLYALFAIVPIFLAAFYSFAHRRTHGILATTTTSVAYDHATHASILSWDRYTLLLEGRPTPILSGEFHYWRLPDRSRWEPTLRQYRSAGLNAIRIYFHWGYHSPKEGVYHFDGNRDIDYLLTLCSRLGILVLAAPGPYICAETQAGGFPTWLIAKRDLRIRHNKYMLWKVYDDVFAGHEMEWYEKVLGIIAKHQATNKPGDDGTKGCVIGVQIDNELFELMGGLLPIGLHDQMRVLAKAARDYGITVPLFSNDGFEEGSWVPKPLLDKDPDSFWSKKKFGLDWYGFDKYVVLAPTSSPKSWVINNELHSEQWSEWNPLTVEHSVDNLEKTVRKFGHGAAASPLFIPELQGGWFNHYQLQHTYDDIFTFYGEQYTRTIFESILAQGTTMASIYMFYGGTNWGTLGDPDVYTSYDYSACIREYGYFSSRARLLRLTLLFARSFAPLFARTDRAPVISVTTSVPHVLNLQRVSVPRGTDRPVEFTFLRNFDRKKRDRFDVTLLGSNVTLTCHLPYKKSFIALGSYTTTTGARLEFSTVPIYLRMLSPPGTPPTEIWIADLNSAGQMAFEGTVEASGTLGPVIDVRGNGKINVVSFAKTRGWARIVRGAGEGGLYVVALDERELMTLGSEFAQPYWEGGESDGAVMAMWGVYDAWMDKAERVLRVEREGEERSVSIVAFERPREGGFKAGEGDWAGAPFVYTKTFEDLDATEPPSALADVELRNWHTRPLDLSGADWQLFEPSKRPTRNAIDYFFTSGQILYRCTFPTPSSINQRVRLTLNVRNRATIYLNDRLVGGHTTYSRQLFQPGAKIGPDPSFLGARTYDLNPYLTRGEHNTLLVLVDSFGLSRQAFVMDDVRNPRGIISAAVIGVPTGNLSWSITGVDVRYLHNPFESTGVPDDTERGAWASVPKALDRVVRDAGPTWYKCEFTHPFSPEGKVRAPLRLVVEGDFTAYIILNGVVIGRYYGEGKGDGSGGDSPQHDFYLMDGLVKPKRNVLTMLVYTWKEETGVSVQVKGWNVERGSGNLVKRVRGVEERKPFWVVKEEVAV